MTASKIQMDQIRSTSATDTGENIRAGSQKKSSLSPAEGLQGASPDATCTCPSGGGSIRHPCPAHPAVEQAGGDEREEFEAWMHTFDLPPQLDGETFADERYLEADCFGQFVYDDPLTQRCWAAWQARAALAQPSPVRSSLLINGYQLRAALDFIAPDGTAEQLKSEACIEWRQQDADFLEAGLYAFCAEYPEEGGVLLDEEPTTAQPSPLQSEQAEAERPEMSPERAAYFMRRFKSEEKLLGPNEQAAVDYVLSLLAQHDRIVGALRADRDSWAEQAEQRLADWDEMRKERDAALARVEQQERTIAGMNEAHAKLAGLYEAAQAQHSVPEGWMLVPVEPTQAQLSAGQTAWLADPMRRSTTLYRAMLAAAPQPVTEGE